MTASRGATDQADTLRQLAGSAEKRKASRGTGCATASG